ncbi:MAG TPA: HAMP domain-containing sensor histidine kinase [Bacillales bacterium]|nr:HAMP domain-containing sensor histidine kinase [Bacillales bacterium]
MSIRKRFFLSNAVMIMMPVFIFIMFIVSYHVFFGGGNGNFGNPYWNWQQQGQPNSALYDRLLKTSALHPEKLKNARYLEKYSGKNAGVIVRKDGKPVYVSDGFEQVAREGLPSFGREGSSPVAWYGHEQYSLRQHDFYFNDGVRGSFFIVQKEGNFFDSPRAIFPLFFGGLLLILILTNLLLSYLMSRSILKPVERLSDAAGKISAGDLDFEMTTKKRDEMGRLIETFDEMRSKLKTSMELRERYENNRRELLASISHDLKTPITSIRGHVEGIKDGVANTEAKLDRYLDTILAKANHMDRLIEELFLYSKLDVKSLPFDFEKVEFRAFLEDYLEELRLELEEDRVQIDLETVEAKLFAEIDRDKMIRVFNNIIYNSVKYNDKSVCRIGVLLTDRGNRLEVKIRDNGPSVPADELPRIFSHFYRTDPSRNPETGGSGLGLAIAKQIIDAHGGSIWAEGAAGEGLCVSFTLNKTTGEGERSS